MLSLNSANSVTKIFVITVKGLKPVTSCVKDQDATTVPARHMRDRILKFSPIHASVKLSDSLNSLNSLNLVKVLLHLGKTPLLLQCGTLEERSKSYQKMFVAYLNFVL